MTKILIVDDSPTIRQHLNFILKRGKYQVIEAVDGQDGLDKLKANLDVALIIADFNMPRMNGMQLLEIIKADPLTKDKIVFMLTTEGDGQIISTAKDLGAQAWFVKPFEPNVLLEALKRYLTVAST